MASLAGFLFEVEAVLVYDGQRGYGPLAKFGVWPYGEMPYGRQVASLFLVLAPVVYAVVTWRLGLLGALAAFAGFAIIGPALFLQLPWSSDPRLAMGWPCCDGTRSLVLASGTLLGVLSFLIVTPITLVVRSIWRHDRYPA